MTASARSGWVAWALVSSAWFGLGCSDDDEGGVPPEVDAATTAGDASTADAAPGTGEGICAACDGRCEEALDLPPAEHRIGTIDYADTPPAGGPHAPCWANYGAYLDTPVRVEEWVHNLEHGAVVFLYHCPDGCAEDTAALASLVAGLPRVIVTEYTDMPPGFAAVSWGHRLLSSCFDSDAMIAFYAAHIDRAPESIGSGRPNGC